MKDFARSDDPAVQAQLDRLAALSVPDGRLGLETIRALLARLGDPQDRLPPVFHVAGTNGKGSTCANLRAMLEADGKRVHVATSPHLVRYNERIRIAGALIEDAQLAALLAEVLDAGEDLGITERIGLEMVQSIDGVDRVSTHGRTHAVGLRDGKHRITAASALHAVVHGRQEAAAPGRRAGRWFLAAGDEHDERRQVLVLRAQPPGEP